MADEYIFTIATSDKTLDQFTQEAICAFAWGLSLDKTLINTASSYFKRLPGGRHTAPLVRQTLDAFQDLPQACAVFVVSDVEYFRDLLNLGSAPRIASNYMRSTGKKPLSHSDDWRQLDALIAEKAIQLRAGLPRNDAEQRDLWNWKDAAKHLASHEGFPPRK